MKKVLAGFKGLVVSELTEVDRRERDRACSRRLREESPPSVVETEEEWLSDEVDGIRSSDPVCPTGDVLAHQVQDHGAASSGPATLIPEMVSMWDRRMSDWDNRVTRVLSGSVAGPTEPVRREIPVVSVGWRPAVERTPRTRQRGRKKKNKFTKLRAAEEVPKNNKK